MLAAWQERSARICAVRAACAVLCLVLLATWALLSRPAAAHIRLPGALGSFASAGENVGVGDFVAPSRLALAAEASLSTAWSSARSWVERSYRRAPALMIGLAATVLLPVLAVAGFLVRRVAAGSSRGAPVAATGGEAASGSRPSARDGLTWPVDAWIEIEGKPGTRRPIVQDLLRIGREADNEIVLQDPNAHRYHAVIRRTEDAEILAIDLSPPDGIGMRVNGDAATEWRLRDGDVIALGDTRLRFQARRH